MAFNNLLNKLNYTDENLYSNIEGFYRFPFNVTVKDTVPPERYTVIGDTIDFNFELTTQLTNIDIKDYINIGSADDAYAFNWTPVPPQDSFTFDQRIIQAGTYTLYISSNKPYYNEREFLLTIVVTQAI